MPPALPYFQEPARALTPGMAELIRLVYEAALDAALWPQVLALFCAEFSSPAALIFGQDFSHQTVEITGGPTLLAAHCGFGDTEMRDFGLHYCHTNVWMQNERLHGAGQVVTGAQLYPEEHLLRTEWGAWMHSQGLFHTIGAVVERQAQRSFNLSALRSRRSGPYTDVEQARLLALMPHLQTAFALHRRLHRAEALASASLSVLDGLPLGVVLLGPQARVLHANRRARQVMQDSGLLRLGGDERLHASRADDQLQLQHAMRQAVTTGVGNPIHAGRALRLRGLDGRQLHLLVTPLPQWASPFGQHAAGAVFVSDPSAQVQPLVNSLCSLYQLTLAEARLAQALVNGLTLQEYADRQAVSIHTVRSQFKSAALKVGVARQADFVRTVLTGPLLLHWDTYA